MTESQNSGRAGAHPYRIFVPSRRKICHLSSVIGSGAYRIILPRILHTKLVFAAGVDYKC